MANKLSFTVAVSVLFDNLNKIANSVKTVFKGIQTEVGNFMNSLWGMVREWDTVAMELLTKKKANEANLAAATAQRVTAEKALEDARLQHSVATGQRKLAAAEQVAYREILLARAVVAEDKAALAVQASNSAARVGMATRAMNTLKVGAGKLMVSMKTMWASFAPGLVISGIMSVLSYFKNLYDESKKIKSTFSDYKKEADNLGNNPDIIVLQTQLAIMNNKKVGQVNINNAQKELQKMLGVEKATQEEINKLVARRIELLLETTRAQFHAGKQIEFEDKNKELLKDFYKRFEGNKNATMENMINTINKSGSGQKLPMGFRTKYGLSGLESSILNAITQYSENSKVINDSRSIVENSTIKANALNSPSINTGVIEEQNPLQKAEENYANTLLSYNNQLNSRAISLEARNKAIDLLNKEIYMEIGSFLGDKAESNQTFLKAKAGVINPLHKELSPRDKQFQEIENNYNSDLLKLDNQLAAGSLSQKKYNEALQGLINNTISLSASLLGGDAAANEFFSKLLEQRMDIALPERKKRDTTYDYKKTNLDINREELDIAEKYLNDYKSAVNEGAQYTQEQLNAAMGKVTSLKDAIKIAEVKEDIKKLEHQLGEGFYSGMKGMVSDTDRIGNAFSKLRDVMNSVDASGWERFMAVWDAFTASMDAYFSIVKVVEQLTEVTKQFSRAKQTEAVIDNQVTGQKVANAAAGMAADISAAEVKAATSTQELSADTAAAAGAAGKSAAKLPFPFNLIAVAAAIGGVIALFASIPKFAYGGIVGGHSFTGDNILARLNSGEMVLNQGQQSRLFGMLNSGEKNNAKNRESKRVEFRIEGTTLMGVLNNTNKRLSKFK